MVDKSSQQSLEQVQAHLRAVLDSPVSHGDELIWAAVSQALGRVRAEIRQRARDDGQTVTLSRGMTDLEGREVHDDVAELAETVTEALVLADRLHETAAALHLNDALIEITGRGLSPPGMETD